jgi:hypothetical protein
VTASPSRVAAGQSLRPRDLVELWERAAAEQPLEAAGRVLAAGGATAIDDLSLGTRDALLLEARRRHLGDELELLADCPACGAEVETSVSCAQLASATPSPEDTWLVRAGSYRIRVRALRQGDELDSARRSTTSAARAVLVSRAIIEASRRRRAIPPASLPAEIVDAVGRSVIEHDPLTEIVLLLSCPECRTEWAEALDTPRLVTQDLARLGRDVLEDVDLLARTYGWSEAAILELPPARRSTYVALALG